jgi:hypothetical protein
MVPGHPGAMIYDHTAWMNAMAVPETTMRSPPNAKHSTAHVGGAGGTSESSTSI